MDDKNPGDDPGHNKRVDDPQQTAVGEPQKPPGTSGNSGGEQEAAGSSTAAPNMLDENWETLDKWSPKKQSSKPGPHDVYTLEEWQQALDYYKGLDPDQTRRECEEQMTVLDRIYHTKCEPALEAGIDLSGILTNLERRFYRIQCLFDNISPTESEIEQFHRVQELLDWVRSNQLALNEGHEEDSASESTQQSGLVDDLPDPNTNPADLGITKMTMDEMMAQAILLALEQYAHAPDDPRWREEAKEMDEGKEVRRDIAIRRYLVDLALHRVFKKANLDHWNQLLAATGKVPFELVLETWN